MRVLVGSLRDAALEKMQSKEEPLSRMRLNDNKAGMEGLDRERINQIIYEASKGKCWTGYRQTRSYTRRQKVRAGQGTNQPDHLRGVKRYRQDRERITRSSMKCQTVRVGPGTDQPDHL